MSIRRFVEAPRVRRGLAASVVVLAAGGLVLFRSPADARVAVVQVAHGDTAPLGPSSVSFTAPGGHGTLGLSHSRLLAGGERRLYAELKLTADEVDKARERAPLSLAIVLDTSGSMDGEKIERARDAVKKLLRDMREDDEIAFVRYSSDSELVQPLARVGSVRGELLRRIDAMSAGGGTNIAPALSQGTRALAEAGKGRVRRVVLVSDGLDSTRPQSEATARDSAERGVTVSSMGIGLDFDEAYMGAVARIGHGNFGFVKDADTLTTFLRRELEETATTTLEGATARIPLPRGFRFVRAAGADARVVDDGTAVELRMGSLFGGDQRRVVLELAGRVDAGEVRGIDAQVGWSRVAGGAADVKLGRLEVTGTDDARAVEEGRDGAIWADAMSALASIRQLEATEAYTRGETARAQALIDENLADLGGAAAAAPPAASAALHNQMQVYEQTREQFGRAQAGSAEGKTAAKAAAERDLGNVSRKGF